ncbi:MAG TPA: AgmX/PglI C-terminal domain-containing protein, partial [Myxococcota bacterium]|nr:AgmX/PglI C-terminal domain-containing protein [Myxococcota bacterium]
EQLVEGDRVDMVVFDTEVCTPLENYVVGRDDAALLTKAIDALVPRSGTNVDIGLKEGYAIAGAIPPSDRNRRMLLITDALLNTGDINPDTVTQIGKAYDESGIRLSGVGVGRQFNDRFLDKLTEKGRGPYVYLGSEAVVDRIFGSSFVSLTQSLAEDVRFSIDLPESLAMARFYGEEASTVEADIQAIHYQAGTTQLFLQDLKVRDSGISPSDPLSFRIRWKEPGSTEEKSQIWTSTLGELLAAEPRSILKARAIMAWSDMAMSRALRTETCKDLWTTFQNRVTAVGDDAELAYLSNLTGRLCGGDGSWTSAQSLTRVDDGGRMTSSFSIGDVKVISGKAALPLIKLVLRRHASAMRYCHQRLLSQNPTIAGKLHLEFVISDTGEVLRSSVGKNTTGSTELEKCINMRFLRMEFPDDSASTPSTVTADLVFGP